jgi:hypothetical protein
VKDMSHYKWLEVNLPVFFQNLGINSEYCRALISADGDKCESQERYFKKNGLHPYHAIAIYLLLSLPPYSSKVRKTSTGWVNPFEWIVENKDQFIEHLPSVAVE